MLKNRFFVVKLVLLILVGVSTPAKCVFGIFEPAKKVGYFGAKGKIAKLFASGFKIKKSQFSFDKTTNTKPFLKQSLLKIYAKSLAAGLVVGFFIVGLRNARRRRLANAVEGGNEPKNPGKQQQIEPQQAVDDYAGADVESEADKAKELDCGICYAGYSAEDRIKMDCCGQIICKGCLRNDVKSKMNDQTEIQTTADLKCPNRSCKKNRPEFSKKLLEDLFLEYGSDWSLRTKVTKKWQDRKSERASMNKREVKSGLKDKFNRWWNNTQVCPGCGIEIQKNGGCKHMTCENCRCNFCWSCGHHALRGQHWRHDSYCNSNTVFRKASEFIDKKIVAPIENLITGKKAATVSQGN